MIPESGFPAFLDADVYEAITLHDNRGLAVVIKNGDGHHARFTFTRSRKQATRLKKVSQWVKEQGKKFETEKHVRLIITKYNQLGSIFSEVITSDGKVVQKTFKAYNGFGEFIGEAEAEERLIDVFYKLDTSGRPWFSRAESGVPTIILHNLLGFETLRLQSDQILLTNKTLTDVPELLTVDEPQLYDGILPNLTKMAICDTTYDGRVLNKFYVWLGEGLVNGGRALPYAANHCVVNVDGVPVAGYFISTSFPEILAHQQAHKWFPNSPEAVDKTSLVKNLTSYGPIKRLASHTFSSGECDPCSEEAQIEPLSSGLRIYIVKPGDTLQSIAQAEYGEACRAEDIAKYAI